MAVAPIIRIRILLPSHFFIGASVGWRIGRAGSTTACLADRWRFDPLRSKNLTPSPRRLANGGETETRKTNTATNIG